MKHLFFIVLLANIVLFIWEFNFGAWRGLSTEKQVQPNDVKKILLLSELEEDLQNKGSDSKQMDVISLLTDVNIMNSQTKSKQTSNDTARFNANSVENIETDFQKEGEDTRVKPENLQIEVLDNYFKTVAPTSSQTVKLATEIEKLIIVGEEPSGAESVEILFDNDNVGSTEALEPVLVATDAIEISDKKSDAGNLAENQLASTDVNTGQRVPSSETEISQKEINAAVVSADSKTGSLQDGLISSEVIPPVETEAVLRCYEIGPFYDEESRLKWLETLTIKSESLHFFSQNDPEVTGYLVYYPAAETFAESKKIFEMLREQGVTDIWLFRKGKGRGNISLGVYTKKSRALRQQEKYADKGMVLVIKPRYQAKTQYFVRLSWDRQNHNVISKSTDSVTETIPELGIKEAASCDL